MNEEKKKDCVVIGVFLGSEDKPNNMVHKREAKLLEQLELEGTLDDLLRKRGWKSKLAEQCSNEGYEIRSISVLKHRHQGCDIAVTVSATSAANSPRLSRGGKPVTRGGKPIGQPLTKVKTMAAKRRAAARKNAK